MTIERRRFAMMWYCTYSSNNDGEFEYSDLIFTISFDFQKETNYVATFTSSSFNWTAMHELTRNDCCATWRAIGGHFGQNQEIHGRRPLSLSATPPTHNVWDSKITFATWIAKPLPRPHPNPVSPSQRDADNIHYLTAWIAGGINCVSWRIIIHNRRLTEFKTQKLTSL